MVASDKDKTSVTKKQLPVFLQEQLSLFEPDDQKYYKIGRAHV